MFVVALVWLLGLAWGPVGLVKMLSIRVGRRFTTLSKYSFIMQFFCTFAFSASWLSFFFTSEWSLVVIEWLARISEPFGFVLAFFHFGTLSVIFYLDLHWTPHPVCSRIGSRWE